MRPALEASRILGLIPARGGSKGIPRKNLQPLLGRPLIAHAIAAARESALLHRVVVSTDDPEIREVALQEGADAPFLRPADLASDTARAVSVIQHAVSEVERDEGRQYDAVVYLEPTSPLRRPTDIDDAVRKLFATSCDSVVSVVEMNQYHPAYMKKIVNDELQSLCLEDPDGTPRQLLEPRAYMANGSVYVFWRDLVMDQSTIRGRICRPYIMPAGESVNIDTPLDLSLAELLLQRRNRGR